MALTAQRIRSAGAAERPYKLADGGGLHLFVAASGTRSWRLTFRDHAGKAQLLTFGRYPELGLAEARERREDAKRLIRSGVDPRPTRAQLQNKAASTVEGAFRAWHAAMAAEWSHVHSTDVMGAFERHLLPAIGAVPLAELGAPALLAALRAVEQAGAVVTARRLRQWMGAVHDHAYAGSDEDRPNPAAKIRKGMARVVGVRHQAALLEEGAVRAAYAAIGTADAPRSARLAAQLVALTVVRCASARGARWDEMEGLDGPEPTWRVPAARMKLRAWRKADAANDHLVPLSAQAAELLGQARAIAGDSALVFPMAPGSAEPIGENAIYAAHVAAGLQGRQSPHGWRSSFSTIMNERDAELRGAIDLALAHAPKDKVEAAYNRAQQLGRRRALLQDWADLLVGDAGS